MKRSVLAYKYSENLIREVILCIFSPQKQKFIDAAVEMFGDGAVLDKQGVRDASAKAGVPLRWLVYEILQSRLQSVQTSV